MIFEKSNDSARPDVDADGIVDSPYAIDGTANNQDAYPLTSPDVIKHR